MEDLQDVIKQESDESGIVAEFQESGPPLLKKIKQEVGRPRCFVHFELFDITAKEQ